MVTNATPAQRLEKIGKFLYGESWKKPLAERLGVDRRTIRRWCNGESFLRDNHAIWDELRGFLEAAVAMVGRAPKT